MYRDTEWIDDETEIIFSGNVPSHIVEQIISQHTKS